MIFRRRRRHPDGGFDLKIVLLGKEGADRPKDLGPKPQIPFDYGLPEHALE
jgi:hypothetical protein